jgi:ubiquinol-cytochrome c reductase cytochrome b subunit
MRWLKDFYSWADSRLQLGELIKEMALHPVPNKTAFMWVVGSLVFLVPAIFLTVRILMSATPVDRKTGLEKARALAQ